MRPLGFSTRRSSQRGTGPVLQVVEDEGCDDVMERGVGERQWRGKVRHVQVGVFTQPLAGQVNHGGTHVEADDKGTLGAQRSRQRPGTAPRVEDPMAGDVASETEQHGSFVVRVEEAGLVLRRVGVR